MQRLSLDGTWKLRSCRPGEGERRGYHTKGASGSGWIEANVPGEVHADLLAAGRIKDPLSGTNAKGLERLEGLDWWYVRGVSVPAELAGLPAELVLEGVDCDCDVYVNGEAVASSCDAHLPIRAKVTRRLRPGGNLIALRVDDGTRRGSTKDPSRYFGWRSDYRMFLRKPQFTLGWDWAPRIATCGIWRPAALEFHRTATIRDLSARVKLSGGSARVEVAAEVELFGGGPARSEIDLALRLGRRKVAAKSRRVTLGRGRNTVRHAFRIARPELWWPAGYGGQPLYELTADLSVGGELCDCSERRIGIRTAELVQEDLGRGERSYVIHVNGEPVFCRGANWVPPDSLVGRATRERYGELIDIAVDANFNMLRIWGGGVYEPDHFFELCDERGIMVYMDFPFACAQYPGDDRAFRRLVRLEAEHHVVRLRNHPSLVLWSGNNEIQQMLDGLRVRGAKFADHTTVLFDRTLPGVVGRLDPTRPYVPSSPYFGDVANSSHEGDRHGWQVSLGDPANPVTLDYHTYDGERGKFLSEWGILSCSEAATIRSSLGPGAARPGSAAWNFHANTFDRGTVLERVRRYVHPEPGKLSLDDYVRASQMFQAEGLCYGIERWRRRKWDCAGSLYWMFNDCWPATTGWTTFDYHLRKKASHYAVRRAYAPVMLSFAEAEGALQCWAVNDTLDEIVGVLETGMMRTTGEPLAAERIGITVPANSSVEVFSMLIPSWIDRPSEFFYARLSSGRRVVAETVRLMDWFRFLRLPAPLIETATRHIKDGAVMELASRNFCRMVELVLPRGVECDENFFDLYPGKKVAVRLTGPRKKIDRVKVRAMNRLK